MFICVVLCLQYMAVKWSGKHVNMKKRCCWGEMTDFGVLSGACVILTSPLTVSRLKMSVCESEQARDRELSALVPANIYTERANLEQQSWANISAEPKSDTTSNNLWTIFQNLSSVKYLWKILAISVGCRKCRGPWSLMSIYSAMTSKVLLQMFWGGYG